MAELKKDTHIRLNPKVFKDLEIIAEREHRSINAQMEHFIEEGIEQYYLKANIKKPKGNKN
jgi:hypothetical protein